MKLIIEDKLNFLGLGNIAFFRMVMIPLQGVIFNSLNSQTAVCIFLG